MGAGIETRHARSCRSRNGGRCDCEPTYRPWVMQDGRRVRGRATSSIMEARGWRKDAGIAIRRGRDVPQPAREAFEAVCRDWLDLARQGVVRARSGDPYKPSAIRGYEQTLRLRVWPELGQEPIGDIRRADLQELVDRLVADGFAPATIQATVIPVKAVFRRQLALDHLKLNPTVGLVLPAVRGGRDRIADPQEARSLLEALPESDRALWATALYAGLRRGELQALRASDVDTQGGLLRVERGWDVKEGPIETKGKSKRRVPIPAVLREHLLGQLLRTGRRGEDLFYGRTATLPFYPRHVTEAADAAWTEAKLKRITLHECRHTFASLMIAAGVNAKALSTYMGHASIAITLDRYGHLMPGNEAEAAGLLDSYLAASAPA
ncbi:MAG TPA: tyrosine-type recombinase/integrase [Thermoleophilaceae bacterium]|nr:tyrosine-type recombinase/integrase [Thermoleophilaceae bacterium]